MKSLFLLLFIILSGTITAQTKLYTPEELREDADFFFEKLYSEHPDPYYFYPIDEFEKLKDSIYSELNKPLSKSEFELTIAQINSYLDSHSAISISNSVTELLTKSLVDKMGKVIFSSYPLKEQEDSINHISPQDLTVESLKKKNIEKDKLLKSILLLPPVEVRGNNLFFWGDTVNNITEINGIFTETIVSEQKKYLNEKLHSKSNSNVINILINAMFLYKYNINPPFRIKFGKTDKEEVLEGMSADKWSDEILNLTEFIWHPIPYTYEIYPTNSMAIFHIQTFDGKLKENFSKEIKEFKKEVDKQNINYIFYDVTINGGGHHMGDEALNIIKHDTVYSKRTEITREDDDVNRKKINKEILYPNRYDNDIPNNRILFVIQSAYTASSADYFCRTVSENKLGILIGEPTGELTKTFSHATEYTMPNTHISFDIASTFVDYSDFFKSLTTQPDINWDLKNIREFSEQELLKIINYYKKTKKQVEFL